VLTRTTQQTGGSSGTAVLAVVPEHALASHPGHTATGSGIASRQTTGFTALAVLLTITSRPARSGAGNTSLRAAQGTVSTVPHHCTRPKHTPGPKCRRQHRPPIPTAAHNIHPNRAPSTQPAAQYSAICRAQRLDDLDRPE
jgi:hypothetical protein